MSIPMQVFICCLIGYVLGNFSPAYLLGRIKGYDVREEGSGNAGATNAFILLGRNAFFLTAILDILKAFAAYKLCQQLFPELSAAGPIGGTLCFCAFTEEKGWQASAASYWHGTGSGSCCF